MATLPATGELSAAAFRYYHQQNAGKRNIAVDLRHPKGLMITKSLVEQADVLIENFRPDVMQRLGLDYDT